MAGPNGKKNPRDLGKQGELSGKGTSSEQVDVGSASSAASEVSEELAYGTKS